MYGTSPYGSFPYASSGEKNGYSETLSDTFVGHGSLSFVLTAHLLGNALASTPVSSKANQNNSLTSVGISHGTLFTIWSLLLTSTSNATTTVAFTADVVIGIIDTLLASGDCVSVLDAKNALVAAAQAAAVLNRSYPVSLSDAVTAADEFESQLVTLMLIVDSALASTTLGNTCNVTRVVSDSTAASTTLASILGAQQSITDTVLCSLSFQLDGDVFSGVVLNTESKGVTEYQNFPFNSFGPFAGSYIGVADDGVYLLEGTDDNGTQIQSYIRTGLSQIANGKKLRIPDAFFGVTTTGDLVMKVITTHPSGTKVENWYKLEKRVADANRTTRVTLGRGLESVYWAFELISVQGSQFGLDTLKLNPIVLERLI